MTGILGFITFVPWNLGLAEIIGGLTLLVTIIGIIVAWVVYRHQVKMIEPWSIKKVGNDLWLLERKFPKLAIIRGIVNNRTCDHYEVEWLTAAGIPTGYFRNGTNVLLRIKSSVPGAVFQIYYQEDSKDRYPFRPQYIHNTRHADYETPPKSWKVWETTLY